MIHRCGFDTMFLVTASLQLCAWCVALLLLPLVPRSEASAALAVSQAAAAAVAGGGPAVAIAGGAPATVAIDCVHEQQGGANHNGVPAARSVAAVADGLQRRTSEEI